MTDLDTAGWRRAFRLNSENRGIMVGVYWNVVLIFGTLAALPFDTRRILGLNPWIKPLKFEVSVIVFLLTIALLLNLLRADGKRSRLRAAMAWGFGIAMIAENSIIATQSARGVRSHMNYSTSFDAAAFGVMGNFIAINTLLLVLLLALFFVAKPPRPTAELWGIRLGLAMIVAGSLEGVRMVIYGSHTVGAADGGAGLPFLNWSTQHGDLRVPHFFALHALQALWLVGWLLSRTRLPRAVATAATVLISIFYAAAVWALFAQASAGHALLALR